MELLNFNKANCKHCYKCLRVCPVKAIKFKNDQAIIVEERCIACGQCFITCPQNARKVHSDIESVKKAIKSNLKVIATLAPSFIGTFSIANGEQMVGALKKLGFSYVEETAVGADIVAALYSKELENNKLKNIITTACPSSNFLIEKYYPELIEYMMPVVSPMIAHGKVLKSKYGEDSFVVFIGPCIAKKVEAYEFQDDNLIDACLTFEELDMWLKEENIDFSTVNPKPFDGKASDKGKNFPVGGGVLNSFVKKQFIDRYDFISIDGVEECINILNTLRTESIEGVCVELNACKGGCINGPGIPDDIHSSYIRRKKVMEYAGLKESIPPIESPDYIRSMNFKRSFMNKAFYKPEALEKDIKDILRSIEKFSSSDELNCGACGYSTCREKAQAVYEGMAETSMCLPYMKNKAERLSNHIFESSPNAILIIDGNLNIVEFNPVCEKLFKVKAKDVLNKPISTIVDDDIFINVKAYQKDIISNKVYYPKYNATLLQNIIYIKDEDAMLVIMTDITSEEKNKKELMKLKENTLNAAQDVIDKQMRVAQEIAGLLGETTAETKVVLTKLKALVLEDGDLE
ncbi:MAG TPA: 4Fe-4S binding protein [Tissierellia bacterium]|nr:4Fe-4S binding protein [Tissierellia bacterium]